MSMSEKQIDPSFERMRIMIGVTLIVVCGLILWKTRIKPIIDHGKPNVWESREEVRDKYLEWLQEKHAVEKRKELIESEKAALENKKGEVKAGGSEPSTQSK